MLGQQKQSSLQGFFSFVFLFAIFLGTSTVFAKSAFAISNFKFESTTKTVKMGQSVEIPVLISTDADLQVKAADLWVIFDPTALDVQSINPGNFFSDSYNQLINSKLYIAGFFSDSTTVKSGDGTYATIYMTPKKIGQSTLKFDCRGNEYSDTSKINVNPQNPQNIIDCASTAGFVLTINSVADDGAGAGGNGSLTPTPTISSGAGSLGSTPTPASYQPGGSAVTATPPTSMPESGAFDGTLYYLLSGSTLIGFGGILRKLYT